MADLHISPHTLEARDLGLEPFNFLQLRGKEILIAAVFSMLMPPPPWKPLMWLVLCMASACLPAVPAIPRWLQQQGLSRLWTMRGLFWFGEACAATSTYFLYVPGDPLMLALLSIAILCAFFSVVMRVSGDLPCAIGGMILATWPCTLRLAFEGTLVTTGLCVGTFMMTIAAVKMVKDQHTILQEHFELRCRAERAAEVEVTTSMAKARFFASVSHDLRQPVHAIGLYLAMLPPDTHPNQRRAWSGIHQSWQALDGMLSQVLDLTTMEANSIKPHLKALNIQALVQHTLSQHQGAAEAKSIRVVTLIQPAAAVLADELMLRRVVSNLLGNAIKFSPQHANVLIALRSADTQWALQVRDAGPGIPGSQHRAVFDEFVQLDNPSRDRSKGLGLGLAIAQRLVRLMDGDILLRSRPGHGTTFTVRLPKADPQYLGSSEKIAQQKPAPPPLAETLIPSDALRARLQYRPVLLVEDDLLAANALVELLTQWHLPVIHTQRAEEALTLQAGLAICDIRLPGQLDGLTLSTVLKSRQIPCLLMTAETDATLKAQAENLGLLLLTKPVDPAVLLSQMEALVIQGETDI